MSNRRKRDVLIIAAILIVAIAAVIFLVFFVPRKQDVGEAQTITTEGVDEEGNEYFLSVYHEIGEFAIISAYMPEQNDCMWNWIDNTGMIKLNYSIYQDDHYIISFKSVGTVDAEATCVLMPINHEHANDEEYTYRYPCFIIKASAPDENNEHTYEVTAATMEDHFEPSK